MKVGDKLKAGNANWRFRGEIVQQFDQHVSKSVPWYQAGHDLVCKVSDYFVKDGSTCYDLGCSTGELTLKLAKHNLHKEGAMFVGIDAEKEMLALARKKQKAAGVKNAKFLNDNICLTKFSSADFITAYYTIQFVRPSIRQELFNKIFKSLNWGGALLLFEKVRANDARFQDITTGLYTDFKLEQGYSAEEIIGKSKSLKGVLEPFSTQANVDMLKRAGFVDILTVMKFICFEGFLAIK
ncbi:MAG: methyltransferase domain-containing protein [Nitrospirales bacterium]|nr:methyltransferase domain-containing protein [Nitrospira sp.]MDR4503132.1 methyltransferase domain-containing protein [Nitrospirales bacterium]